MEPTPPRAPAELPEFQNPSSFPEHAPPILHRRKLSKRQFARFTEQLPMFMAGNLSSDFMITLQALIRLGDIEAMKMFLSTIGLSKSTPQTVVNLQQNNNMIGAGSGANERTIDTLVRQLDERDRKVHSAITVEPVKLIEAE